MPIEITSLSALLLVALSLSIGWGIRGNFGHEYGAALPGVLASFAIVLISGRPDWWAMAPYVAMFGALGWAFGGSMSYMQVIAYTHSGHPPSSLYGYANLYVIGFVWAAVGGGGAALPLFLTSAQITFLFVPIIAVIIGWSLQAVVVDWFFQRHPMRRHESPLYWFDTDWLAALIALISAGIIVLYRGGLDIGTSLIFHLSIGWYAGFLLLVNLFKLRMTPPRGDNWSGCVGLTAGLLIFAYQYNLTGVFFATLITGLLGGIAYSSAQMIKHIWIRTGWQTNWHSVLEQTQGLFFGIGFCLVFSYLSSLAPRIENNTLPPWTQTFPLAFVFLGITYLNHRKCALTWVEQVDTLTERPYGLPVAGWLRSSRGWVGWVELFYFLISLALYFILSHHQEQSLAIMPQTALGTTQIFYLVFLWWIVVFNFDRAIVRFAPPRLITEGLVTLNAILCSALVLCLPQSVIIPTFEPINTPAFLFPLLLFSILTILCCWGVTHLLFGKQHVPHAGHHIRFGPNATATKTKPKAGINHP